MIQAMEQFSREEPETCIVIMKYKSTDPAGEAAPYQLLSSGEMLCSEILWHLEVAKKILLDDPPEL